MMASEIASTSAHIKTLAARRVGFHGKYQSRFVTGLGEMRQRAASKNDGQVPSPLSAELPVMEYPAEIKVTFCNWSIVIGL
jgi:hypothetical protein